MSYADCLGTKKALYRVWDESWDFLCDDLQVPIYALCSGTDNLINEYVNRIEQIKTLEERVKELESLLDDNEIRY